MAMTNANNKELLPSVENDVFDCNNNDMVPESGTKRPSKEGDVNERSRKLIKSCFVTLTSNLNVLVIGSKGSGKRTIFKCYVDCRSNIYCVQRIVNSYAVLLRDLAKHKCSIDLHGTKYSAFKLGYCNSLLSSSSSIIFRVSNVKMVTKAC